MCHYMQTLRERDEILDVHREVDPKHELAVVTQVAMRPRQAELHRATKS